MYDSAPDRVQEFENLIKKMEKSNIVVEKVQVPESPKAIQNQKQDDKEEGPIDPMQATPK